MQASSKYLFVIFLLVDSSWEASAGILSSHSVMVSTQPFQGCSTGSNPVGSASGEIHHEILPL